MLESARRWRCCSGAEEVFFDEERNEISRFRLIILNPVFGLATSSAEKDD